MTRFLQHLAPALALASTALLTACGGGGSSASNNGAPASGSSAVERYAIATAYNGNTLASYAVNAQTGLMRLVDKAPSLNGASAVVVRPGSDEVVAITEGGALYQYGIETTGELDFIKVELVAGSKLSDLVVHPTGNFVYVSDRDNGIYQMAFDDDGEIIPLAGSELEGPYMNGANLTGLVMKANGQHLYAADIGNDQIAHFAVGNDGSLSYVDAIPAGDGPYKLALHHTKNTVYAVNRYDGSISQYRITENGSLESLDQLAVASNLEGLAISNDGKFLYASDLAGDQIWQFSIATNGTLQALVQASIALASEVQPRALIASPVSDRIYLADQDGAAMLAFSISATGELSAMSPDRVAMDAFPTDLVFTTGAALKAHTTAAYVINSSNNNVSQFLMDDAGTMTALGDNPPQTGNLPAAIATHPSGKYVYVANYTDDTVSQYRRVSSAIMDFEVDELKAIQADASMDLGPTALAVHPSGNYLYVVCKDNNSISTYKLKNNGEIEDNNGIGPYLPDDIMLVDEDQFGFPAPSAITIDPAGRYLWVSNNNDPGIAIAFQIDPADGSLTKGDATSVGAYPRAITVNADGSEVYIAAAGLNAIRRYSVDANGNLVHPAVQEIPADQYPAGLALSPFSNTLYAANTLSSNVSQFDITNDGSLAAMNPASISSGLAPQGIAIDPTGKNLLVANQAEGSITRFRAASNGALSVQETLSVGISPQGVAIVGYTE